jgi:CBS domain-containing protein
MAAALRVGEVMRGEKALVTWSDPADAALGRMRQLGCERLAVVDAHGVIGMCELGTLLACERRGTWLGSVSVGDLIRPGPFWCRAEDSGGKALDVMARLATDTLAVIDRRGRVVGVVNRGQLAAGPNGEG